MNAVINGCAIAAKNSNRSLTFDVLAADLDAVRQDLDVSRVAVLGYSIMGVLALEYGRRFPDTVSHLIMAGTPPTRAVLAQTPMRFFDPRADATDLFADVQFNARLFEHVVGPLTVQWNIVSDVGSLRVPILLTHGRYDYAVPYTMWTGVVDRVPNATLHLFERSGHQAFYEEPAQFATVARAWMAQVE